MKNLSLILLFLLFGLSLEAQENHANGVGSQKVTKMVAIPGGYYTPFLQSSDKIERVRVQPFYLDIHAVTNREFLDFVKANPKWAKSKASSLFIDVRYMNDWENDFDIGNDKILNSPVTNVSWFAAQAYAKWVGKRLPTMYEWEYAASSLPVDLPKNVAATTYILNWYGKPTPKFLPNVKSTFKNEFGVYDMLGLVWEWVYDFNSIMTGGDSRSYGDVNKGLFCAAGGQNAINKEDYASFMRFAFRENLKAAYSVRNLGFRCAKDK